MAIDKNKLVAEATRYVQKGQWDRAIKTYERILAEDPRDVRVLLKIGELQQKQEDPAAAAVTMNKVAEAYTEQGFFLKAVAVYKQIVKLTPDDVRVNERLAALYQQLGILSDAMAQLQVVAQNAERAGDEKRLVDVLRRMTDLDPDSPAPAARLGELLAKQGDEKAALELLQRAAERFRRSNRLDEYVKVAERVSALDPGNVALGRELSNVYLGRGETRRALAKLQLCFKADPKDAETLVLLAHAFTELGQVSKTASVYKELARIHQDRGRVEDARRTWKKVLELVPDDPDGLDALGDGLLEALEEEPEPARAAPAPAAPVPPAAPAAPAPPAAPALNHDAIPKLLTETDVYVKYGLHAKAAEHLDRIFLIDPDHLESRERARDVRALMGDVAGAVEHGARAVRLAARRGDGNRARSGLEKLRAIAPDAPVLPALEPLVASAAPAVGPGAILLGHDAEEHEEIVVELGADEGDAPAPEAPAPVEDAPAGVPAAVAATGAPAGEHPDLSDDLAELDFYVQQGLLEEAREALEGLRALYPGHPELARRVPDLGAPPAPEAVAGGFDLGAELAGELATAGAVIGDLHYSVDDALDQFKKGVEQQIRPEDVDTHHDLGIAYKEMGLLDEAIHEFEVALAAHPGRKEIDCLTMIGLCRMEKQEPAAAIDAFGAALRSEHATGEAVRALQYELAAAWRAQGDPDVALWYLQQVLAQDPEFRDARAQVEALGGGPGRPPAGGGDEGALALDAVNRGLETPR